MKATRKNSPPNDKTSSKNDKLSPNIIHPDRPDRSDYHASPKHLRFHVSHVGSAAPLIMILSTCNVPLARGSNRSYTLSLCCWGTHMLSMLAVSSTTFSTVVSPLSVSPLLRLFHMLRGPTSFPRSLVGPLGGMPHPPARTRGSGLGNLRLRLAHGCKCNDRERVKRVC